MVISPWPIWGLWRMQRHGPFGRHTFRCWPRVRRSGGWFSQEGFKGLPLFTWNPNGPCFDWKKPSFGGVTFKNRGHLGSRYIELHLWIYYLEVLAKFKAGCLTLLCIIIIQANKNLASSQECGGCVYKWKEFFFSLRHAQNHRKCVISPTYFWRLQPPPIARWWFQIFFIFTPIWGRFPVWLIFFRWVGTTNQIGCALKRRCFHPKKQAILSCWNLRSHHMAISRWADVLNMSQLRCPRIPNLSNCRWWIGNIYITEHFKFHSRFQELHPRSLT